MARELKDINGEYAQICMVLGERVYQSEFLSAEIAALKLRCKELQNEGAEAVKLAKEATNEQPADSSN